MHLKNCRIATTQRIKKEYESRAQRNLEATTVLQANFKLWKHVGGPSAQDLTDPSDEALHVANEAKELLIELRDQQEGAADNNAEVADEILRAVDALKNLNMKTFRKDKFPMTPEALFQDLVRNMKGLNCEKSMSAEALRRKQWLAKSADAGERCVPGTLSLGADKFGCDPYAFSRAQGRQEPHHWGDVVQKVGLVYIDETRTLLELHYDDVNMDKYQRRVPTHGGQAADGREATEIKP